MTTAAINKQYEDVRVLVESLVRNLAFRHKLNIAQTADLLSEAQNAYLGAAKGYKEGKGMKLSSFVHMRVNSRCQEWLQRHHKHAGVFMNASCFQSDQADDAQGTTPMDYAAAAVPFIELFAEALPDDAKKVVGMTIGEGELFEELREQKSEDISSQAIIREHLLIAGWDVARIAVAFAEIQERLFDFSDTSGRSYKAKAKQHVH